MTDLLPCPFCGGKAERLDLEDGENAGGSCITCTRCQASGNVEFGFKENFVSNWNRRAHHPEDEQYDRGRRDVLNAILALNPDVAAKVAAMHDRPADPYGRLPFDVVLWVTEVAEQLGIKPKHEIPEGQRR